MATKSNRPGSGRLTEIVAYRRSQGSSVTGALAGGIKERLKEKFDPRQLINQKGLMTALFPGLKTYQAKTAASEISKSSMQVASFDEIKPTLEIISFNTKMTAKNTMVLPALHRDVNVMRQNIVKLVKLKVGDARTKSDMYFVNAKEREEKYERELKKEKNKKDKLEKSKIEEEKKSKSIFEKIVSSIVKGLSLIVSAITNLGKAILGAFKFLGNIIGSVISTIAKSLLNIGNLLLPTLTGIFLNLFKGTKFVSILFKTIVGSIFRTIFTKAFLNRFALSIVGIIAGLLGIKYISGAIHEQKMIENKGQSLSTQEELRRLSEIEKLQTLPTNVKEEGKSVLPLKDPEERMKWIKSKKSIFGNVPFLKDFTGDIENTYHKQIIDEFAEFKRTFYSVRIPGLQSPYGEGGYAGHPFFLTQEQASWWGRSHVELKRLFNQLSALESKDNKTPQEINKMRNIAEQIKILKDDMRVEASQLVNEQIQNPDVRKSYLGALNSIMKNKLEDIEDIAVRNMVDDTINSSFTKENLKVAQDVLEEQSSKVLSPLKNLSSTIQNNIMDMSGQIKQEISTARREYIDPLIDKTLDNRRSSVVFKQPVVINQENNTKKSNPVLGSPASAWNNDFIENYFSDILTNPLKNISY